MANTRRWGTPGSIGTALATRGVVEGGDRGAELLRKPSGCSSARPPGSSTRAPSPTSGPCCGAPATEGDAREPLRAGFELARRCGALPLAKRAHDELGATGEKRAALRRHRGRVPDPQRAADCGDGGKGLTNRQIAQELFLTVKTIETHLAAAYDKLGIRSRRELPDALGPEPRDQPARPLTLPAS